MHSFSHGDRVRYATTADDGFPLVRYGFVGGMTDHDGPVVVMLDGELGGDIVDAAQLEPVHISNVTLTLSCADFLDDPELRHGLVNLWRAEAEEAGLQIVSIEPIDGPVELPEGAQSHLLGHINAAGENYRLCAVASSTDDNTIVLQASL